MKAILIVHLATFFINLNCVAQKHDYIWVLGHNGGTTINFNGNAPDIEFADRSAVMELQNASISDSLGNLLFYTNGCDIYNKNDEVMLNGNEINPGNLHNDQCEDLLSAYRGGGHGAFILPLPNNENLYYLFHQGGVFVTQPTLDAYVDKQYFSIIDMSQNNGLGNVLAKNQLILVDTFHAGDITSVKHDNNLFWWIIFTKRTSNKYFKVLFTNNGIESLTSQAIGNSTLLFGDGGGQALFSPDGTKYVRYNYADGIIILDFDRATGEFSNYQHIDNGDTSMVAGGAAISPNSRYLYISSQVKFYQYDLQAPDIAASQVLLGEYDGFVSPFATTFYNCQLAPDCKIYCNCYNSCDVLHVVNYPDEPGLACDFVQHGVQLPTSNALSLPNFPNYRLGTGQPPCVPSASGEVEQAQQEVRVYPNPASGQVTVSLPAPLPVVATWSLHDALGRELSSAVLSVGQQEVAVGLAGVPPGLYFWQLHSEGKLAGSGKLVVLR